MLFYTIAQELVSEELMLFDTLTDRCLLCTDTGSRFFPALQGAVEGDRFRIIVSHLELADSLHIQGFDEDDYAVWIDGRTVHITSGAADELNVFRRMHGADQAWVTIEKIEEVAQ
jgi:hypothetical protein